MQLNFLVKIPQVPGKIVRKKKKDCVYIDFEYARVYNQEKRYNIPKRATIGKQSGEDPKMMYPNQNYFKFFPDADMPQDEASDKRSSCLRLGAFLVIRKAIQSYHIREILLKHMPEKDADMLLDLATYCIVCENNASQYYPDYAYNHPLHDQQLHIYSDSTICKFLRSITDDIRVGFLNDWNAERDHREKIYISYDSTNKNSQAGDLEMVEYGHPKVDVGAPVFNIAIAYDTQNRVPLFYEEYPGSIVDVSQLQYMLAKATAMGYRHVGFILDRGYFSKCNLDFLDDGEYEFIIMLKGKKKLVSSLIEEHQNEFENKRKCYIRRFKAYGMTVKDKLYAQNKHERYLHLFFSDTKRGAERAALEARIERMSETLEKGRGKAVVFPKAYNEYFDLFYDDKGEVFLFAKEKDAAIEKKLSLCGYYVIVTSHKMTAEEALTFYKGRDPSEKLFRGDKSYLGGKSLRITTDEAASAKNLIEFIALISRNRIYNQLVTEALKNGIKANYMTVPATLRELEKIEMLKLLDGRYHLSHAVTATQKTILRAFDMDEEYIKAQAAKLANRLAGEERDGTNG